MVYCYISGRGFQIPTTFSKLSFIFSNDLRSCFQLFVQIDTVRVQYHIFGSQDFDLLFQLLIQWGIFLKLEELLIQISILIRFPINFDTQFWIFIVQFDYFFLHFWYFLLELVLQLSLNIFTFSPGSFLIAILKFLTNLLHFLSPIHKL